MLEALGFLFFPCNWIRSRKGALISPVSHRSWFSPRHFHLGGKVLYVVCVCVCLRRDGEVVWKMAFQKKTIGTYMEVQWLRLTHPVQGVRVWTLVREIRSHMLCDAAPKRGGCISVRRGRKGRERTLRLAISLTHAFHLQFVFLTWMIPVWLGGIWMLWGAFLIPGGWRHYHT